MRGRLCAGLLLVGIGSLAAAPAPPAASSRRPALFKDSRQSLAIARAQGRKDVVLLIAAKPGAREIAGVVAQATRLGGDVRYRDDEVGYLRVKIAIDKATELAGSAGVQAATVDYDDHYPMRLTPGQNAQPTPPQDPPAAASPAAAPQAWPPQLSDYPLTHPYSPLRDIAAADFQAQHPTYDGRGVTIALLDGNFDMFIPEFQTAYTLDGKTVPKVADYLNVTDPRDDADLNPQWVDMKETVKSSGGRVTYGGKTFLVPHDGTYRIGFFSERRFNMDSNAAYIDQDIDRNGNPKGDDGLFGVLWDEATNDVWVDTNRDLSFTDEKAMTDYVKRPEFGTFGKDDPKTPYRDTIGFAVQTDKKNKFVSINVGVYQHATTIMGSVVGNKEPHGRLQGVAPGARMVSVFYGASEHGVIEGMLVAFRHPQVDLIVLEQSVAFASIPYLLADSTHPISVIAQRLTERYKKLMFVPGDNLPAFGFVAEEGLAPGVMSIGGYQNKESYRINNGFVPETEDNMHWGALSHGPSGNGGLKPDLLAPSGQMGTEVAYRKGAAAKGLYQLPPGYSVDGGTSTATPMAAGATALVVSAAKQTGVPFDAARLKAALIGSTRHIENLAAHEQGNGLIQVGPAYALLAKMRATPPMVITSRAPVRTRLSGLLPSPNEGIGIYEREGWKLGETGERTITLTRETGSAGPMTFGLSWVGNDGTFASASSVVLPLHTAVPVAVKVSAKSLGAHSAILSVDNAGVPGHAHRILNTIVVPLQFTAENGWEGKTEVKPAVAGDVGVFVDVPPGVAALTFTASSPEVGLSLIGPDRDPVFPCLHELNGKPNECTVATPQPGVWEINLSNNKMARNFDPAITEPIKAVPVSVTVKVLGVTVTAGSGASFPKQVSLENRLAKVTVGATPGEVGSARRQSGSIVQGGQNIFEVVVPKGATSLRALVDKVSDPGADLDVYLLNCTDPEKPKDDADGGKEKEKGNKSPAAPPAPCAPAAKAADLGPGGEVASINPRAGRWVIVVDGFRVPRGPVSYELTDVFTHPSFGAIAVVDAAEERAPSSRWTARFITLSGAAPDPSRRLEARIVATSSGLTAGTGVFGSGPRIPVVLGAVDLPLPAASAGAGGGR